ncbi:MAG: hypothetical protein GYB40_07690 [Vibrionaceae bacterium]|nr:hypothetical protein [Vibrionaceae bacterium]MBR9876485.1 hypothetical protein [Vibrionaceae bacterium]
MNVVTIEDYIDDTQPIISVAIFYAQPEIIPNRKLRTVLMGLITLRVKIVD